MPFDIIFCIACLIWFSSTTAYSVLLGTLILTLIFSLDKTDKEAISFTKFVKFTLLNTGTGILANAENSFTIFLIPSTCLIIVLIHERNISGSKVICFLYFLFIRSAAS